MKDEDPDSLAGRLTGIYADADKYVEHERASWQTEKVPEQRLQHRRRPRISDEDHSLLLDEVSGFAAGDDVTQEEINDLL